MSNKTLYTVDVVYTVKVVAGVDEWPQEVAERNLGSIVQDKQPRFENMGAVYGMDEANPWYGNLPYGDTQGKPCEWYTIEAIAKRKSGEDILARLKNMLTSDEWEALQLHLKSPSNS